MEETKPLNSFEQTILDRRLAGDTLRQIAARWGAHVQTVREQIPNRTRWSGVMELDEYIKAHVSPDFMPPARGRYERANKYAGTPKEQVIEKRLELMDIRKQGMNMVEIRKHLNMTQHQLVQHLKALKFHGMMDVDRCIREEDPSWTGSWRASADGQPKKRRPRKLIVKEEAVEESVETPAIPAEKEKETDFNLETLIPTKYHKPLLYSAIFLTLLYVATKNRK